jgi:hypothetical protein
MALEWLWNGFGMALEWLWNLEMVETSSWFSLYKRPVQQNAVGNVTELYPGPRGSSNFQGPFSIMIKQQREGHEQACKAGLIPGATKCILTGQ